MRRLRAGLTAAALTVAITAITAITAIMAIIAIAMAAAATATAAPTATPLVEASITPSQITLGQTAELMISTSGSSMEPVRLPEVSGLDFRIIGQSHRVEIVRGATLVTTAIVVRVTPRTAGVFTIPAFAPQAQPLVLRVNPDSGSGASPAGTFNNVGKAAPGARADGIKLSADGSAYLRLILPKRDIYVGESIPIEIELGMRNGFVSSLNGLPTLTGAEFTLNNLSHQPERVQKLIDNQPFTLLTWHSVLAPVKPGTFSLAIETPITVRIRTRPQRESTLEDMLGDPFLQNYFGATVPKDITISSPPAELTVLALPTEGKPADFSGAVGSFKVASDVSPAGAAAGDPLTLRLHVTGSGNFDRVDSAMLEHLDDWKTYPPKSSFKQSDALGYKGEKIFEQPVIAARPGAQTLPAMPFSYFDPATRRYETAHTEPLTVTIAPSLADRSLSGPAPSTAAAPPATAATAARDGLRPDHAPTADHRSLLPLYWHPGFLALPSLLALACAGGWLQRRRSADSIDWRPDRIRGRGRGLSKAARQALRDLESAARARNAALFFNLARRTLIGTRDLALESEEIRELAALADEASYAGYDLAAVDFERWLRLVRARLLGEAPS